MDVSIAVEMPLHDDVRAMISEFNASMRPVTPREFHLTVEEMAGPGPTVLIARKGHDRAVGMGLLKEHDDGLGEVKRMVIHACLRGFRMGSRILAHIVEFARGEAPSRLVLETGEAPCFGPVRCLYEKAGFIVRGTVLDYSDSGCSRFYEKKFA